MSTTTNYYAQPYTFARRRQAIGAIKKPLNPAIYYAIRLYNAKSYDIHIYSIS